MAPSRWLAGERYRLDGRIAAGGMGDVWRGWDMLLSRPVAVKLLRPEFTWYDEALARFRAEAQHAGALLHPAIAKVYNYCEPGPPDPPFLVMELVEGPSLAALLREGPMDPARTMDVVAQAAAGLQAAHASGLVHRDIKPANLLLTRAGEVKLTDFGIAHVVGSAPITLTGIMLGTPAYLAPERAAGASATPASDLYALGVIAYQCLTGSLPFEGDPLTVVLAHHVRGLPRLPRSVPTPVAALVRDLTARNPRSRPSSAGQVAERAERLRGALAGNSPGGSGPATTKAVPRPATRPPLPMALPRPATHLVPRPAHPPPLTPARPLLRHAGERVTGGPAAGSPARPPGSGSGQTRASRGRQRRPTARAVLTGAAVVAAGLTGWLFGSRFAPETVVRSPHPQTPAPARPGSGTHTHRAPHPVTGSQSRDDHTRSRDGAASGDQGTRDPATTRYRAAPLEPASQRDQDGYRPGTRHPEPAHWRAPTQGLGQPPVAGPPTHVARAPDLPGNVRALRTARPRPSSPRHPDRPQQGVAGGHFA
jgi:serine/threonine protein kinase